MESLEQKERLSLSSIFVFSTLLLAADIYEDMEAGSSLSHVLKEVGIVLMGIAGMLIVWYKYLKTNKKNRILAGDIQGLKKDLDLYKLETKALTEGLSLKIDEQLNRWSLTTAEKDVALMVLKGLTNAEIAGIRHSSESTIRGQITAIFKKSGLHSRSELSAFFLEDLLIQKA